MQAPIEIVNTHNQTLQYTRTGYEVAMTVYPRIHMFPIDLSLISGIMKNGSFGYSLLDMPIKIAARRSRSSRDSVHVEGGVDIANLDLKLDFDALRAYTHSDMYYEVTISLSAFIREHTGLGMSTQILGGVYACCAKLSEKNLTINDLYIIGLGHHSALGLNLLFNPGMIFEMGTAISKDKEAIVANPMVSQELELIANTVYKVNQFPFYSVIAIPKQTSSVTNEYGDSFFNDTLPNKNSDSYRIVYSIFETMVPSIIESNYELFVKSLKETTNLGIKKFEQRHQSERTKEVLGQMREVFEFASVSSLGPTLFAFSDADPVAQLAQLRLNVEDYDFVSYRPTSRFKKETKHKSTLLIASFAAMGKTTFAIKYPDIAIDIESIHYERIYAAQDSDDEVAKNDKNWIRNPDYPANYVRAVLDAIGKYQVIFLTLAQPVLGELDKRDIKYTILYPGPKRKQQILIDAKNRGNDDEFVDFLDRLLSTPDHRIEFEGFRHESFKIINDSMYIEEYLKEHYDFFDNKQPE